jgi:NCS1 family nucleobase:cation symporter-1
VARHGKPWHQFAFWFGGNVNVFNVIVGAVTVSIGLTFWQALMAIAVGTLIGALLIALHATQGPGSACRRRSRAGDSSGSLGQRSCSRRCW